MPSRVTFLKARMCLHIQVPQSHSGNWSHHTPSSHSTQAAAGLARWISQPNQKVWHDPKQRGLGKSQTGELVFPAGDSEPLLPPARAPLQMESSGQDQIRTVEENKGLGIPLQHLETRQRGRQDRLLSSLKYHKDLSFSLS